MTAQEHIVAWIESSAPHYAKLLQIADTSAHRMTYRAALASNLAREAYAQMATYGDAADDYTAQEILGAAIDLLNWEKPE